MQGVMQQMPPLPVRLNVELANNFLPKAVANGVCQMPYMAAPMHAESLFLLMCKETHLQAIRYCIGSQAGKLSLVNSGKHRSWWACLQER